jgi:hypothetical protein
MTGALQALAKLEKSGMLSPLGFKAKPGMTYRQFEAICFAFAEARESLNFVAGDMILAAETMFGDEGYQAIESMGLSVGTRQQCVRVSERIPMERRRKELSWSHHRAVVAFEPKEQDEWLERAVAGAWAKHELETAIRDSGTRQLPPPETTGESKTYIVEPVLSAAERVYAEAQPTEDDSYYQVPAEPILNLGRALGAL